MSKRAALAVITLVIGALPATSGAGWSHPAPDVAGVTHHVIRTRAPAALGYWTPERMRHARTPPDPIPHRRAAGPPVPAPTAPDLTMSRLGWQGVPGAPWSAAGAVAATTGRVFFTINGGDFVCSASTVRGANRDLVVTAGHCALDSSGAWAENWIYVPGYDRGRRPYGVFAARHMFVPTAWSQRRDEDYDVAMVTLATSGGRHVADVAGAQGIAFDRTAGPVVYGFGYPIGGRYDGEQLMYCAGRTHPDTHRLTRDQGLRCDMAEGASGGPWLTGFDAETGRGVVVSVNSFKYADDPATMYGPYFGPEIRRVYDAAQRA